MFWVVFGFGFGFYIFSDYFKYNYVLLLLANFLQVQNPRTMLLLLISEKIRSVLIFLNV